MRFVSVIVRGQPCLMTHSIPGEIRSFTLSMFWSVILSPGTTSARTGVPSIASESEATPARVSHQRGLAMVPSPSATWLRTSWLYNASPAGVNGTSALAADRSVHVGGGHAAARKGLEDQVLVIAHVAPDQHHDGIPAAPRVHGGAGRVRLPDRHLDRLTCLGDDRHLGGALVEPEGSRIRLGVSHAGYLLGPGEGRRERVDQVGRNGGARWLDHRPPVRVAPGDDRAPAAPQPHFAQLPGLERQEALARGLPLGPLDPPPFEQPVLAAEQAEQRVQDEDLPPAHAPLPSPIGAGRPVRPRPPRGAWAPRPPSPRRAGRPARSRRRTDARRAPAGADGGRSPAAPAPASRPCSRADPCCPGTR